MAHSLLLNKDFIRITTGTCLLFSMSPCFAANSDDAVRGWKDFNAGSRNSGRGASFNQVPNGFTQAFNNHVQRNTTGLDSRRLDLDLSSSVRNIELGSKIFRGVESVTINAGGNQQTFAAGDQVTAAQYVAIQQVLTQSPQSLNVSSEGTASGGSFSLNSAARHVNDLVIPQSVSAVNNFANNKSINLSGDLTNLGSIYALSTDNKVRGGVISADDINNGGSISTDLNGSFLQDLKGTVKNVDLTLVAENNFNNAGTITSSGALTTASAYGGVNNSGSITAQSGDLNIFAGNGNLNNSGALTASDGNLNIAASQLASDLTINGVGGSFNALQGDINVRDLAYTDLNDTTMTGGTYDSKNLNVYGGGGTITTNVDEITGELNTTGLAAHIFTSGGTLTLGDNCLTGDPTFVNTTGDIVINGAVIAREDITILAAGNITATGNAFISTYNSTGATATPSTNITLVAGALVTNSGTDTTGLPTPGTPIGVGQTATVNFTGGLGGNIDLSGSSYLGALIDTSSNLPNSGNQQENGGNVVLAAFSTNTTNGFVKFPEARLSIDTSSLYGNSGTVTIIAGNSAASTKSAAINVGTISTAADPVSGGNSGDVLLYAAQPETTTGAAITYNAAGARVGVVDFERDVADLTFTGSSIQFTGSIHASGADVTAVASAGVGGLLQKGTGRIEGDTVTITTGTGGVGSGKKSTGILTEANELILNSGGNVTVNNIGSVNLGNGTTPGGTAGNGLIFSVTTQADGNGDGRITIANNGLITAQSGTLAEIRLTSSEAAGGTGGIRTNGTARLIATLVTLADVNEADGIFGLGFGDIGQNTGNPLNIEATTVAANTQGNVFVLSNGVINVSESSAGNGKTFNLQTDPVTSTSGQIILLGDIKSAFGRIGTLTLASSENGGVGGIIAGGVLVADVINLSDDNNAGQVGRGNASLGTIDAPIVVDTRDLNVDTLGPEINIVNIGKTGLTLQNSGAAALRVGSFTLLSASTVNVNDVFAINGVNITTQSKGNIIVSGDIDVSNGGGSAFLTTSTGNITNGGGLILASNVVFTSSSGSVGSSASFVETETNNLTVNGGSNAYIENTNVANLNLIGTTARGQFTLETEGSLSINSAILTPTGIKLVSTTGNNIVSTGFSIGSAKATGVVEIDVDGGGDILVTSGGIVSAKTLVTLSTDGGDIGNLANNLVISSAGLSANTNGAGIVAIDAAASKKLPLTVFNSSSGGDFSLDAAGSLLLNNIQTENGSITVTTSVGTLATNTNSIIQVAELANPAAGLAQITLQNSAAKAGKTAAISIGAGSTIQTFANTPGIGVNGNGAIRIFATATPGAPTNTTPPANVVIGTQSGGGQTFFGANGITALAPNNTMENIGADIVFDTGTKPASAILLGGNVLIHADPPVSSTPLTRDNSLPIINGIVSQPDAVPTTDSGSNRANQLLAPATSPLISSASSSMSAPALPANNIQLASNEVASSSNTLTNFATLTAALSGTQSAINFAPAQKDGWISDTELSNGQIPARVFGDVTVSGDDTAGAELEYPAAGEAPSAVQQATKGQPLVGSISANVGGPKVATLHRGTLVVAPSTDTVINTPVGQIKVGAKSLALVMAFADGMAVYDLDDVRKGAIEIVANGKSITLSPGQHVFVTSSNARGFEDVNPAQMIGYRGITSRDLNNGLKAFTAEFNVPHAVSAVKPLKHLLQSKHPQDKKVAEHLLKTTAVTMQLRGRGGDYQQVFRPRKTAWAQ